MGVHQIIRFLGGGSRKKRGGGFFERGGWYSNAYYEWYLQDPDEAGQTILLCDYLQERKRWDPADYFLYSVFDHG